MGPSHGKEKWGDKVVASHSLSANRIPECNWKLIFNLGPAVKKKHTQLVTTLFYSLQTELWLWGLGKALSLVVSFFFLLVACTSDFRLNKNSDI